MRPKAVLVSSPSSSLPPKERAGVLLVRQLIRSRGGSAGASRGEDAINHSLSSELIPSDQLRGGDDSAPAAVCVDSPVTGHGDAPPPLPPLSPCTDAVRQSSSLLSENGDAARGGQVKSPPLSPRPTPAALPAQASPSSSPATPAPKEDETAVPANGRPHPTHVAGTPTANGITPSTRLEAQNSSNTTATDAAPGHPPRRAPERTSARPPSLPSEELPRPTAVGAAHREAVPAVSSSSAPAVAVTGQGAREKAKADEEAPSIACSHRGGGSPMPSARSFTGWKSLRSGYDSELNDLGNPNERENAEDAKDRPACRGSVGKSRDGGSLDSRGVSPTVAPGDPEELWCVVLASRERRLGATATTRSAVANEESSVRNSSFAASATHHPHRGDSGSNRGPSRSLTENRLSLADGAHGRGASSLTSSPSTTAVTTTTTAAVAAAAEPASRTVPALEAEARRRPSVSERRTSTGSGSYVSILQSIRQRHASLPSSAPAEPTPVPCRESTQQGQRHPHPPELPRPASRQGEEAEAAAPAQTSVEAEAASKDRARGSVLEEYRERQKGVRGAPRGEAGRGSSAPQPSQQHPPPLPRDSATEGCAATPFHGSPPPPTGASTADVPPLQGTPEGHKRTLADIPIKELDALERSVEAMLKQYSNGKGEKGSAPSCGTTATATDTTATATTTATAASGAARSLQQILLDASLDSRSCTKGTGLLLGERAHRGDPRSSDHHHHHHNAAKETDAHHHRGRGGPSAKAPHFLSGFHRRELLLTADGEERAERGQAMEVVVVVEGDDELEGSEYAESLSGLLDPHNSATYWCGEREERAEVPLCVPPLDLTLLYLPDDDYSAEREWRIAMPTAVRDPVPATYSATLKALGIASTDVEEEAEEPYDVIGTAVGGVEDHLRERSTSSLLLGATVGSDGGPDRLGGSHPNVPNSRDRLGSSSSLLRRLPPSVSSNPYARDPYSRIKSSSVSASASMLVKSWDSEGTGGGVPGSQGTGDGLPAMGASRSFTDDSDALDGGRGMAREQGRQNRVQRLLLECNEQRARKTVLVEEAEAWATLL